MPIYLRLTKRGAPIKGDVTVKAYEGWIELESCQLGTHRGAVNGSARAARPGQTPVNDVVVTKREDSASHPLFRETLVGEDMKGEIHFAKANDKGEMTPHFVLELTNTMVSSYSVSGSGGGGGKPVESMTFTSEKLTYTVKDAKAPPAMTLQGARAR